MNLKRLLLVLLLSCLLPSYGFSDVIFTDAQYEELSQTLDLLQKEQEKQKKYEEERKKYEEDLMRAMQEQQSYYKKRTTFWIAGSALMIIASSVISYEVGKYHECIR